MSFLNQKVELKTLLIGAGIWSAIILLFESGAKPYLISLASIVALFCFLAFCIALFVAILVTASEKQ